jgi:predicted nucleic acid-binding protein
VTVVADTSLLIDYLAGFPVPSVNRAMVDGVLVLPPLVVAELITGAHTPEALHAIFEMLQDVNTHHTDLLHWIEVGKLRRLLGTRGINVTVPDGHIAQCALELDATLLSRDAVFRRIAKHVPLRVSE